MNKLITSIKIGGGVVALGGIVCLVLAPLIGQNLSDSLWVLEPLTYIGAALLVAGLGLATSSKLAYSVSERRIRDRAARTPKRLSGMASGTNHSTGSVKHVVYTQTGDIGRNSAR